MRLRKPAVLITGGARRLGLALTQEALALGLDVVAHYRTSAAPLKRWLSRRPGLSRRVQFLQADLHPDTARTVIAAAQRLAPRLCGLVNNAAVFTPGGPRDRAHLRAMLQANAVTPYALGAAFHRAVGAGWIVHITDARAAAPNRTYRNYRLSKLLLEQLTGQQALRYAPSVRVNAIAPGAVLRAAGTGPAAFRALLRRMPLGNGGTVGDIRRAFAYLYRARSVTGQVLYVDGGWHVAP